MSLAENIRARRQELKLSQVYVGDRLGVSRQAVSKWEAGRSELTASNLVDLKELLEISVSELVRTPSAPSAEEKSTLILRTNLSLMAITLQAGVALCTYHLGLGLLGTLLLFAVLIFYVLYISPKYMNRPFGKKNAFQ